jgi:hypothetical protein
MKGEHDVPMHQNADQQSDFAVCVCKTLSGFVLNDSSCLSIKSSSPGSIRIAVSVHRWFFFFYFLVRNYCLEIPEGEILNIQRTTVAVSIATLRL